jgi:hypothetical protein
MDKIINNQRTKAHTLPSRTSRHTSQNLAKSVLFPTQKEIQFFFSFPLEKIKTPDTQTDTTKTVKLNNDNCLQGRWTRTPAANITYTQAGFSCFVGQLSGEFQVQFFVGSLVVKIPACV